MEKARNMSVVIYEDGSAERKILSGKSYLPIYAHSVVNVTSVDYSTKSLSSIVK